MNNAYQSLPHGLLIPGSTLPQFQLTAAEPVSFDDPAASVFTDFAQTRPYVTNQDRDTSQRRAAATAGVGAGFHPRPSWRCLDRT